VPDKIRLTSIEGGGNWWHVLTWAEQAFRNAGFDVEMSRYDTVGLDTIRRVVKGEADIAITLAVACTQAIQSSGAYKGENLPVQGLAFTAHPGHHFYNIVRADLGIKSFADIAKKKPKLELCVGNSGYIAGQVASAYLKHYGVDLYKDIEAWGGHLHTSFPQASRLFAEGKANSLMRENTRLSPAGVAAQVADMVCLPLDPDIAAYLAKEYGTPVYTIKPGTLRGQTEPVLTVTDPGYPIVINPAVPNDVAYRLAKALNVSSDNHWCSEDIFYSIRHAPETFCPVHPGAAKYYREVGVMR
jgi:TRAP-type uncharacterized transport system substrate-binding protein